MHLCELVSLLHQESSDGLQLRVDIPEIQKLQHNLNTLHELGSRNPQASIKVYDHLSCGVRLLHATTGCGSYGSYDGDGDSILVVLCCWRSNHIERVA